MRTGNLKFDNLKLNKLHTIFEQTDCLYSPQDYIAGELSAEEQYSFEKHILSCAMCRDEYEGLLAMKNQDELPGIINELDKNINSYLKTAIKFKNRTNYKILRFAALILVLIGSGFFINYYTQQSSKEYAAEEMVSQSVGAPDVEAAEPFELSMDSTAMPTIASGTDTKQKNDLTDEAIVRKLARKDALEKSIPDNKKATLAEMDVAGDSVVDNVDDLAEENEMRMNELAGLMAKEKAKEEQEESDKITLESNYKRAKSSSIDKKTAKGYADNHYLEQGITAYNNGNFEKAIDLLKKSKNQNKKKENDKAIFYIGLSYASIGNSKKAMQNFELILKNSQSSYYNDANWQKALLLIKRGKNNHAIEILKKLLASDSYAKEAKHKLDSLGKK